MHRSLGLISIAAFSLSAWSAVHFDPPDLNLEYQLHKQYLIAHGELPPLTQGTIESYQLQPGESLWGLSQMLYGDGNYWPKVWAQNKSITNPHLIRPGHMLNFLMGSEDDTPSFRFSEAEEPGLELAAGSGQSNPQIEVPPPEIPPRPVINVPGSFPPWQEVYKKKPDRFRIDDSKMLIKRHVPPDRIPLTAFVQEKEIDSVGTYLEAEKESGLPVANQFIYVKMKKGIGQVGQKYLIVHDQGNIRKLNDQVEGEINARFVQVFGDIEITEPAQPSFHKSSDLENFEVFRALILHAVNLTITEFDLIPGQMQIVDMGKNGPQGTATAQVIGSNKHQSSALYGPGDIVFLNKGSQDGISAGQILDVYIDRSIRDQRTPVTFSTVSSGMVKIAKVSTTCSTAVILSSIDSIQQGDRVQPKMSQNFAPKKRSGSVGGGASSDLEFDMPTGGGEELPSGIDSEPGTGSDSGSGSGDDLDLSE